MTLLGYFKVLEAFPQDRVFRCKAAFTMGRLYEAHDRLDDALFAYGIAMKCPEKTLPEPALAHIQIRAIKTRKAIKRAVTDPERNQAIKSGIEDLGRLITRQEDKDIGRARRQQVQINTRAMIAQAKLMVLKDDPESLLSAIDLLDQIIDMARGVETRGSGPITDAIPSAPEAMLRKGEIYERMGKTDSALHTYIDMLKTFPGEEKWQDRAVARILHIRIPTAAGEKQAEKVRLLVQISKSYEKDLPRLAMAALNHAGDLYFAAGQWQQAKSAYREVLTRFPIVDTQTAAARLALAEILYREERFRQALDLYETEMGARTYEDTLYGLIRDAYFKKALDAADFHYRLSEVPAAQNDYLDLIREDYGLLRAHRGYIKCAASRKQIPDVLIRYRDRLKKMPDDPVTRYAIGLCLTYMNGMDTLNEARSMVASAIKRDGQVAYFHQTLGYIDEVSETVYGQPGGLEKALQSYQKAYFLNNPEKDPKNGADLALNLGNIYFLLGNFSKAHTYYRERLNSEYPFDHADTEILFYRRLGASAFQLRDPSQSLSAYEKALDLIQRRIDPQRASEIMGKLNTQIFGTIITPAISTPDLAEQAGRLGERQAGIHQELFQVTGAATGGIRSLPDPAWPAYKAGIEAIIEKEENLIGELAPLLTPADNGETKEAQIESLSYMITRAKEALNIPDAFLTLKAEMLDRLALAYQEQENWNAARKHFEQAYALNKALGLMKNLSVNRRSVAYTGYMAAEACSGEEKRRMLQTALDDFHAVIQLIDQFGVKDPKTDREKATGGGKSGAFMSVSLDIALDKAAASKAMYGFTAEQEKRLARTYISRIEVELGKLTPAEAEMTRLLSVYEAQGIIPDSDIYGTSLLYHRAGQLAYALNDPVKAFHRFKTSAELSLRLNNPVSSALNVANMAHALSKISRETGKTNPFLSQLRVLDRQTAQLLNKRTDVLKADVIPMYHNTIGALLLKIHGSGDDPVSSAAERVKRLETAGRHFSKGIEAFEKQDARRSRKSLAILTALHLNMAQVAIGVADPETASAQLHEALQSAQAGLLPEYEWRALARMGRLKEALSVLASTPVIKAGCAPNEITHLFRPLVVERLEADRPEAAFNLMETLSEIERVNRLSPLVLGRISRSERQRLTRIYPRLIRIQHLSTELEKAGDAQKSHLQKRRREEQHLLRRELGDAREKLPSIAQLTASKTLQDRIMVLLGAAFLAEKAADEWVETLSMEPSQRLKARYQDWLTQYESALADLKRISRKENEPEIAALFSPDPVQLIDIMENLPPGHGLIRLIDRQEAEDTWRSLIITPQNIVSAPWKPGLKTKDETPAMTLLWENPDMLPRDLTHPVALSATHLLRCIRNTKPFKRRTLALAYTDPLPPSFVAESIPLSTPSSDLSSMVAEINSLILNTPAHLRTTVPTRPGQTPVSFMAADMDQGRAFPLLSLKGGLSNVSLVVLPKGIMTSVYPLAHLFSFMGVPTVLLPRHTKHTGPFVQTFFSAYQDASVHDAFSSVTSAPAGPAKNGVGKNAENDGWMQIGFWGLTPDQARVFAKRQFKRYVQNGVRSFKEGRLNDALIQFENALVVAREDAELRPYVTKLHTYARESAFSSGRFQEAHDHAGALVALLAQKHPDSEAHATALLKLGLVDARLERYDQAIPNLEKGIEILSRLELGGPRVSAINDLGVVLENATDYHRALEQFESAASLIQSMDKPQLMAKQYMRMGRIYDLRLNRFARAKQTYQKALDIYKTLGENRHMSQALLDMGRASRLMGNFEAAETCYQNALKLIEKESDTQRLVANIRMEQANNAWFQADYQDAFELQNRVYKTADQHDWPLERVMALNTSGLIWWTLGDHQRALRELKRALDLAETLRIRKDEKASTLNNMGLVYRDMGEFEKALEVLDAALSIDTDLNSRWGMAYDLKNQAMTYLMMNAPQKALPLFSRALKMAKTIGNQINVAKILVGYGDALQKSGRVKEATVIYNEALTLSEKMRLRETVWRALYGLSRICLSEGNREKARELLARAIDVIEGMRADIRIDQLKDGFVRGKMDVYETLVSLLVKMGKPKAAFDVAERSRARNLIDLLGNQRLTLKGAVDQKRYDEQRRLQSEIRNYEALLAQSETEAERQTYENGLKRVRDAYGDLMLRIQSENPELASLITVNPLTLKEIQSLIDPDVALLAFYVVPDRIFCWVITRESTTLLATPVGRETLRETILRYRRMLQNIEPIESDSKTLYSWLLSRVRSQLKSVDTVGIIPHDALHHLSFATLYDGKDYLADRLALFYLPSASVLKYTRERRSPEKRTKVLAIGNPDLKNPAFDLPFAEHEVSSIRWNFPQITILTGDRATEGWVVRHAGDFGIVHMASHGEFDPINPLFSAIKLASDSKDDGDLEASEIFGLRLNADLVVLSACQTGLGKVTAGDDVIGLNRAFLYAGTHAILSSLWRVSDISTAMLIKQFYRDYASMNKANSLKNAILHVKNRFVHPGYWGAFVLVGDYH
ncbi:MAG: CHAT domain-containing protein [Deltaproteobacteria bacterium]|nr:CHAT domain-containing protein [Deltaproteobacteria bacterium]